MQLQDWVDCACLDLSSYGVLGKLQGEDWQNWGAQLFTNSAIGRNIPNPYAFADWFEWAERVCEAVA